MYLVIGAATSYNPVVIGEAVSEWVHAECITSLNDRNAFLDDLESARGDLALPLDDPKNLQAQKHYSHHNRQRLWGEAMTTFPEDDFATARHIFNLLMQMSGAAKRMCYFVSTDQEDYAAHKSAVDVIAIDAAACALKSIKEKTMEPDGSFLVPDAAEIQNKTLSLFARKERHIDWLRTRVPHDFGQKDSPATRELQAEQKRWMTLVTDSILTAAAYREGALAAVPFLEAKSITDEPAVYYPFAQ